MLPRTSAAGTPALAQSAGMIVRLMYPLATGWARTENSRSACSPVLRSVRRGWAGRSACHVSMAWPTIGSTGLVNAVPVLRTGTSSRQTASPAGVGRDGLAVVLPADAAGPQPDDLVAAQPGEQPGQGQCPDQLDRVVAARGRAGQVAGLDVQAGVQQLGPHVIGDHPGIGADQRADAARDGQRAGGIEPAGDPLPFLAVAEERPGGHELVGLGARGDRLPGPAAERVRPLDVVADRHPVDGRDPRGARLPGPLIRLGDLRVLGGQPPPGFRHDGPDDRADPGRQGRGGVPPLDPLCPGPVSALDHWHLVAAGPGGRLAVTEVSGRFLEREQRRLVLASGCCGMAAQRGERLGVQVPQAGAAVDEQRLGQHAGQLVPAIAGLAAVTPLAQDRGCLAHRRIDGPAAEDELRQVQPVEHAQVLEIGEAADQVGQRDQEGAHGALGRQRPGRQELPAARAGQPGPLPAGPAPVGLPGVRAVLQDDRCCLRPGPPELGVIVVVQGRAGGVQRHYQARDRVPVPRGPPRDPGRPVAA
jgi:hypothetical protein